MPKNQSNGYRIVYSPTHERSYKNGTVYEHILVAEKTLNRKLKPFEVVHHKDANRMNNDPSNLIVFTSNAAHSRFHANKCQIKSLTALADGTYDCVDIRRSNNSEYKRHQDDCPVCGNTKSVSAHLCYKCRKKYEARNIPSRDRLLDEIIKNNGNFTRVAKLYGVTDNAVRKWCKKYNMSYKSSDYRSNYDCVAQTV